MSMQGEKIYNLSKEIVHLESQVHEAIADKRKLMDDFKKQDDQLKAMALQSYDDNFKIIRFKSKIQDMDEIICHQKAKLDSNEAIIKMLQEEIKKLQDQVEALSK